MPFISHIQKNLTENYSLTPISQELERIRSIIQEIQYANLTEEKKRTDYSFYGSSPSPSVATEEESIKDKQLFEEWFGCLTEEKEKKHTITEHHPSLHVPIYDTGRSYSQTLV